MENILQWKNISNDMITKVIALPYYPYTKFSINSRVIYNETAIVCQNNDYITLEITLKDQSNNILEPSEHKLEEAYIYNNKNNDREEADCYINKNNYRCGIYCNTFNVDSFLLIKFKSNENTGNFIFNLNKN